jgi:hypothetical protein
VSYESIITDPAAVIPDVLGWIGIHDEAKQLDAVRQIDPKLNRSSDRADDSYVPSFHKDAREALDLLYHCIHGEGGLSESNIRDLNAFNDVVAPIALDYRDKWRKIVIKRLKTTV